MSDIRKIGDKFYDFKPKNQSFLQTAAELKQLGIKNYYNMLEIKNPRIADLDPYSKNLTPGEIKAIMEEAHSNLWYYSRCIARVVTDSGVVPFYLHRGLYAALWCFLSQHDFCLCEPRQTYKTSGILTTMMAWSYQLSSHLNIHFFNKKFEDTKRNLTNLKKYIELLPEWLKFEKYVDTDGKIKKNKPGVEKIYNKVNDNSITIHPSAANIETAEGIGRGASAAIHYYDELEFTPFIDVILSNAYPVFNTAANNARAVGKIACRVMSTTPGNLDTKMGDMGNKLIKSMIPWSEHIYDMSFEQLKEYINVFVNEYNAREDKSNRDVMEVFYIEYHYNQIRKDWEWVEKQLKGTGDKFAIRREIFLQRQRGSTDSPFDIEDLNYLLSAPKRNQNEIMINNKWLFKTYKHGQGMIQGKPMILDENIPYIVGVDPAAGGGGDNVAMTIVNPFNLEIAAEFKNPYISATELVRLCVSLVNDYIPNSVLVIEKNSMGHAIIPMLLETSIRGNIYWSEKEAAKQLKELTEDSELTRKLKSASAEIQKYGTYVSESVRKIMFELLFKHMAENRDLLIADYLVDDLCKLIQKPSNERIEARKGEHDDCVMSYLHVLFVFYYGENLDLFGINREMNPIIKQEIESEEAYINKFGNNSEFTSIENITFEQILETELKKTEDITKMLVNKFGWINDDAYDKDDNQYDLVDIPDHFFDMMNGI